MSDIAESARDSVDAGAKGVTLERLAVLGKRGKWTQNIEREAHRLLKNVMGEFNVKLGEIPLTVRDRKAWNSDLLY